MSPQGYFNFLVFNALLIALAGASAGVLVRRFAVQEGVSELLN